MTKDDKKPKNIQEYAKWMSDVLGKKIDSRTQNHFESVVNKLHADMSSTRFWQEIAVGLLNLDQEYTIATRYPLLLTKTVPELVKKPYKSFLDKTFRKNILNNKQWPDAPPHGWVVPETWFSQIGDLIRTTIVVKYLDGVDFVVDRLAATAKQLGLRHDSYFEARDEGYYAAHFYVYHKIAIPTLEWKTREISVSQEIQITTQLQEVIRRLLHSYYEEKRSAEAKQERAWQWQYRSDEFSTNYLGHILHYLEGMIVEIREKRNVI